MIDWLNPSDEMLEGLQAGREELQNEIDQMYTQEELDKAVGEERLGLEMFKLSIKKHIIINILRGLSLIMVGMILMYLAYYLKLS